MTDTANMTTDDKLDLIIKDLRSIKRRLVVLESNLDVIREGFLSHRDRLACLEREANGRVATPTPAPVAPLGEVADEAG